MKMKRSYALIAGVLSAGLTATAAKADTVTLTFSNPTQSTLPGGALSYSGIITAAAGNSSPVYLYGDTITFNGPADISFDDSGLLTNFPESVAPGETDTGELFTADVPLDVMSGSYSGTYVLEGGADANASDVLDSVDFTLDVGTPLAVTPEPSSQLLFATGLAGIFLLTCQRRLPWRPEDRTKRIIRG